MRRPASSLAIAVALATLARSSRPPPRRRGPSDRRRPGREGRRPAGRSSGLARAHRGRLRRRAIESPSGPYPSIDSVYQGGGATGGGGYRQYVGDRTFLNVRGLYSMIVSLSW